MDLFVETDNSFQLKNYCRLCALYTEELNLIEISQYSLISPANQPKIIDVPNFLEYSLNLRISELSSLPKQICQKCLDNVVNFYYFKLKCQAAEEMLKEIVKKEEIVLASELLFEEFVPNDQIVDQLNETNEHIQFVGNPSCIPELNNIENSLNKNIHNCLDCREVSIFIGLKFFKKFKNFRIFF